MVLDGGLLVAVGAVVVAHQHVCVHVAHADPVVALGLAALDAFLVAGHAGVDDVLGLAGVAAGGEGGGGEGREGDERGGAHGGG